MRRPALLSHPLPAAAVLAATAVTIVSMVVAIQAHDVGGLQLQLSRLALVVIALTLAGLALYFREWTTKYFSAFFNAAARPFNLAFYRIVLFGTIFLDLDHDANPRIVMFFASLPKALQFPPPGLEWLAKYIPMSPSLAQNALHGLTLFSFLAMIGLFTRVSATLTVCFALYALGIAQFYGQINHYHHMLWFGAIMAASRCGDVLSVDAFLAARKRGAKDGVVEPPSEERAYSLPLKLVWITLGLLYFWPGFWKYWNSGMGWAFSDNFKHQLHLKWMQRDWISPIRIDYFPILMMPAAFATLVWELGFLPAVFFPRLRVVAAVIGAMFHVSTRILMHISFWTLQTTYLSLFNWDGIFRKLGKSLYADEMLFIYDGNNAKVRARVAAWRTLDVFFGRVTYVNVHDHAAMKSAGTTGFDVQGVRAIVGGQTFDGSGAWRKLAGRIPPLWPVLPLVGLSIVTPTGDANSPVEPAVTSAPWFPRYGVLGVTAVFLVLLAGNTLFGLKEQRTGYPFTCYPPFSRDPGPVTSVIQIEPLAANGEPIVWDEAALKHRFGSARYVSLIKLLRLKKDPAKFHAFWQVVSTYDPKVKQAQTVNFWETTLLTDPAVWNDEEKWKVSKNLVYTYVDQPQPASLAGTPDPVSTVTDAGGGQPEGEE